MAKRWPWIVAGVLVLVALTTTAAWAAGTGGPAAQEPPGGEGTTDALWVALTPLLAIATFIERVLEVFWDRWEKAGVWPNRKGVANTSAPEYVAKKRLHSHWIGTVLALIAIGLTNVRLFRMLGLDVLFSASRLALFNAGLGGILDSFSVGTLIDWLMTAAIIGWGGTEITHSIIEGLVRGRNLWKEMREVQAGQKSILDSRFFGDYIAPRLAERGISVETLRQAFQTLQSVGVSVDEFLGSMTVGQVDSFLDRLVEKRPEAAGAVAAVRDLLEGVPAERKVETPNILALLPADLRRRFLGG